MEDSNIEESDVEEEMEEMPGEQVIYLTLVVNLLFTFLFGSLKRL